MAVNPGRLNQGPNEPPETVFLYSVLRFYTLGPMGEDPLPPMLAKPMQGLLLIRKRFVTRSDTIINATLTLGALRSPYWRWAIVLGMHSKSEALAFIEQLHAHVDAVGHAVGEGPLDFSVTSAPSDAADLLRH